MSNQLVKKFAKLPNYCQAFGVRAGIPLFWTIERMQGAIPPDDCRPHRIRGYDGPIWLRNTLADRSIFWQVLVKRQYDITEFPQTERLTGTYDRMVRQGSRPVIIDCGGNIGLSAVWFASRFPEADIYVLEPDAANFEMLRRNIAPYSDRIHALQGGVWKQSAYLAITNPESGSAAFRVEQVDRDHANALRAFTIDEVLALSGADDALIVKLDIEGSQKELFSANTDWVGRSHAIILELDDWLMPWKGTSRPFFSCLSRYPFDYLLHGEHIVCFRDGLQGPHDVTHATSAPATLSA